MRLARPPTSPPSAKSRTPEARQIRKRPEGTNPPISTKRAQPLSALPFLLCDQDGAAGGVGGWVVGAGAKVRGHTSPVSMGKKENPPARETRNFSLFFNLLISAYSLDIGMVLGAVRRTARSISLFIRDKASGAARISFSRGINRSSPLGWLSRVVLCR